jgi:superfamily II DNA helicase RecQ
MQIKIFTIPVFGGEVLNEELNLFLRSKKILQIENQLISDGRGASWSFCVRYLDDVAIAERREQKVDYRQVLNEAEFKRFSVLRDIRKRVAEAESVPPYVVFTDAELAELAKMEQITPANLKKVKGIGEKKIEKYGHHFQTPPLDEQG